MTLSVSSRGLLLALAQLLLVAGIGAKLLVDRERLPRVWVEAPAFDPALPIRGRYANLTLAVLPADGRTASGAGAWFDARLEVRDGQLTAVPERGGPVLVRSQARAGAARWVLAEPALFFLPEHAADPTRRAAGEELWVEVTVPDNGPPRPIRLGVRRGAAIEPLGN